MAETHTYDGDALTIVRRGSVSLTQAADHGVVGNGQVVIDDTPGTQEVVGQKDYRVEESDCANTRTFQGFVGGRQYGRDAGLDRAPDVGAARAITVALLDTNDRLNHILIRDGGKRPGEKVQKRLEWLIGSAYAPFDDLGRVSYPNDEMDKADYRYQYAGDVLADCALAAGTGWNYHVQNYGDGPELIFRNDDTSTDDSSDVRISNDLTDVDSDHDTVGATKTFAPLKTTTLSRESESVHSVHAKSYAKGTVVETRAATAAAFNGERGGTSSNSNIKRAAQASRAAKRELRTHSTEDDVIEVTIQVPPEAVNLIYQGFRVQCKFTHLATEGYGSFTWMRILERTVRSLVTEPRIYEVDLKLVPQGDGSPAVACPYDATESGTYYPLGQGPEGDSHANPSDGVVYYLRGGIFYPVTPWPGAESLWHFPRYGVGGAGSTDFAGDCVGNELRFIVVGNGTMTIQTEICDGNTRPIAASWGPSPSGTQHSLGTFTSGDVIEVEVENADDENCVTLVRVFDGPGSPCGGKWGWSAMEWTAA